MTLGEAINAAASAGARVVEAREKLHRLKTRSRDMQRALPAMYAVSLRNLRDALAVAEIDHAAALGVLRQLEAAAGVGVGGRP